VPEQFETVHARHDQIGNDDIRVKGGEQVQRFLPVRRALRLKVSIGKHGGQGGTLAFVIIDNEDSARRPWRGGHWLLFYQVLRERMRRDAVTV
jgi:hypothetical protein